MNVLAASLIGLSFTTAVSRIYPDSSVANYAEVSRTKIQELKNRYPLLDEREIARLMLVYYSLKTGGIFGFRYWNNSADGKLYLPNELAAHLNGGRRVDCDEASALLVGVLRALGYDAHLYVPFAGHVIVRVNINGYNIFMDPTLGEFADPFAGGSVYDSYFSSKEVKDYMLKLDRYYTNITLRSLDSLSSKITVDMSESSVDSLVEKVNALSNLSPEVYAAFVCACGGYYYDLSYDPFRDAMKKTYLNEDFEAVAKAYKIYFNVDVSSFEAIGSTWAVRFLVWLCQYGTREEITKPAGSLEKFLKTYF